MNLVEKIDNLINEDTDTDLKKMGNQLDKISEKLTKIVNKDTDFKDIQVKKLKEFSRQIYNLSQEISKFT